MEIIHKEFTIVVVVIDTRGYEESLMADMIRGSLEDTVAIEELIHEHIRKTVSAVAPDPKSAIPAVVKLISK